LNTPVRFQDGILRRAIDLFLFSSLFIAVCALGMIYQTYFLFVVTPYPQFIFFVFFATLCSYNFHWYLTPAFYGGSYKANWSVRHKRLHLFILITSIAGCIWFGIYLLDKWPWLIATAFINFLYSAPKIPFKPFIWLRKIAVGKTIFLSLVWTHCTVILPLVLADAVWSKEHFLFTVNRFFLIYAICILFDFRDREQDKRDGVKSMITHLPEKGVDAVFLISLGIFFITGMLLHSMNISLLDWIALLIPGIILLLVYKHSKRDTSDYYYYFFLDGLMMFSALLIFIIHFCLHLSE
jgi:4-hydroxybenzoate polyprenyltransferase